MQAKLDLILDIGLQVSEHCLPKLTHHTPDHDPTERAGVATLADCRLRVLDGFLESCSALCMGQVNKFTHKNLFDWGVQRRRLEEELSHKDEQLNEMRAQCALLGSWREEEYAHITEDEKQRRYGQGPL